MRNRPEVDGIPTLDVALDAHRSVVELRGLASLTGDRLPKRKADLVDLLSRHLAGAGLYRAWERLGDLERNAVAEVVHSDGTRFDEEQFLAKYGSAPAWGRAELHRGSPPPSVLHFFFHGPRVMPDDVKERLRAFVPRPPRTEIRTVDPLPPTFARPYVRWDDRRKQRKEGTEAVLLVVRESERAAQRELLTVLRLVDAGKVQVSQTTRKPSGATLTALAAALEGGDFYAQEPKQGRRDEAPGPIRAFAWPLLLQAGKLAGASGSRLQLTKAGRAALGAPPAQTLRVLWDRWLDTTLLDELSRIDCVKGQAGKGKRGLTAVAGRRAAIADTLAACPQGRWFAVDDFLRFLCASGAGYSVAHSAWSLYVSELQYGSLGYDAGERLLDSRYLFALLLEYAATLGLLDVALVPPEGARRDYLEMWGADELPYFSRYDGLLYARVNALGAFCLGTAASYAPACIEAGPAIRVLPDLEVAAMGEDFGPADRCALDAYAVPVSERVWRLDAGRLREALDAGRPVSEIREFLLARSAGPLPETVTRLLDDAEARGTHVRDRGAARLLECVDAALAALIANDTKTSKHCLLAGERHLVVPAGSEAAFRRALRDLGYVLAT